MAPLEGLMPIPDDAPEAQNPLVAMVPDYDSPASKKSHSLVMEVKATAGASAASTHANSGEPLEAE
jgi:hypothetical protein